MKNGDAFRLSPFTTGLILGISVSLSDILLLLDRVSRQSLLNSGIFTALAATAGSVFLAYIVCYYTVGQILVRILKLQRQALIMSLAFLVGLASLLMSIRLSIPGSLGLSLFQLSLPLFVILMASLAVYFATEHFLKKAEPLPGVKALAIAFPFLIAEMVFSGIVVSGKIYLLSIFVLFLLTGWIFYRCRLTRMPEWCLYILALFMVVGFLLHLFQDGNFAQGAVPDGRRNNRIKHVVLITIDTLRSDAVSAYNVHTRGTPNIDQLANDGILFRNAVSEAPWTLPAIASIMTGVSPLIHLATEMNSQIPTGLPMLAEYMQKAGYQTGAIGRNPHLVRNVFRGFQFYKFFPKPKITGLGGFLLHKVLSRLGKTDVTTADLTGMAQEWIEMNSQQDFFLWLHYFDPHMPYSPPPRFLSGKGSSSRIGTKCQTSVIKGVRSGFFVPTRSEREWIKSLYLGEVQYVDDEVGKLINTLRKTGLYDSSLIILTSDHGEEFWEHGSFEHAHTVYNELLRVPLIIKLPGSTHKNKFDPIIPTSAILPTILDLCEIQTVPDSFSSRSLTALWKPHAFSFKEDPVISTGQLYFEKNFSLQFDAMKYIQNPVTHREELYDLKPDPTEQFSIAGEDPEKLKEMRGLLQEKRGGAQRLQCRYKITGPIQKDLEPSDIETLRSLGYAQ